MDKINKNLLKIPSKQRQKVLRAAKQIRAGTLDGLDVKKLKDSQSQFRVRVGDYRIIFEKTADNQNKVVWIAKRDEKTYRKK